MPNVLFLNEALAEFSYWAYNDRKVFDKINKHIIEVLSCKSHYGDK
ncbi:MAG: hypothetical protein IJK81_12840 [Selenomonadaceae bacterium]|nr:hypothetical protein [Selenomonadaceae bacterium]